jgi:hypothetical protein
MKRILFILLILLSSLLIFLVACTDKQGEGINTSQNLSPAIDMENNNVMVSYGNGNLSYAIIVEKPSPCYSLDTQTQITNMPSEQDNVSEQVNINIILMIPDKNKLCTQLLTYDTASGDIPLASKPGRVTVRLDNIIIYSSANIKPKVNDAFCRSDYDCTCGKNIRTGSCAVGNRENVDPKQQCPDFCGGIAGNLEIKCVENECVQRQRAAN